MDNLIGVLRILKFNRLLRVATFLTKSRLSQLHDQILLAAMWNGVGEVAEFSIKLFMLMTALLWIAHLGCCFWYTIADAAGNTSAWNTVLYDDAVTFHSVSNRMWIVGMYWAISTMFAGGSPYAPVTVFEYWYACSFVLLRVLMGGMLVTYLMQATMKILEQRRDASSKLKVLDKLFKQHHQVMGRVSILIHKHIKFHTATEITRQLSIDDVPASSTLPPTLRQEFFHLLCVRIFPRHSVSNVCIKLEASLLWDLSSEPVVFKSFCPGVCRLASRSKADTAYFVYHGPLTYSRSAREQHKKKPTCMSVIDLEHVKPGQLISELALWIDWIRQGSLETSGTCELLEVSSSGFQALLHGGNHPIFHELAVHYCNALVRVVHTELQGTLSDTTHVLGHEHLVFSTMPLEMRFLLSKPWLDSLRSAKLGGVLFRKGAVQGLEHEVMEGKCDLVNDSGGGLLRVVPLVLLRLSRSDGYVLVQIAKMDGDPIVVSIKISALNTSAGEMPEQTLARLADELCLPNSAFAVYYHKVKAEDKALGRFVVRTNYIESTLYATLKPGYEFRSSAPFVLPRPQPQRTLTALVLLQGSNTSRALLCAWMTLD